MSSDTQEDINILIFAEPGVVADSLLPHSVSTASKLDNINLSKVYIPENNVSGSSAYQIKQLIKIRSRLGSLLRAFHGKKGFTTIPFEFWLRWRSDIDVEHIDHSFNNTQFVKRLKSDQPDYILLLGFTEILNKEVIDVPTNDIINFHWSKLPSYRGRNATFWPVYHDENETGVTFHTIDEDIDQGEIILQETVPITDGDDRHSVSYNCLQKGKQLLSSLLIQINSNNLKKGKIISGGEYYSQDDFKYIRFDPFVSPVENLNRLSAKGELSIIFENGPKILATNFEIKQNSNLNGYDIGEIIKIDLKGIHIAVKGGIVIITQTYYLPAIIISYLTNIKEGMAVV